MCWWAKTFSIPTTGEKFVDFSMNFRLSFRCFVLVCFFFAWTSFSVWFGFIRSISCVSSFFLCSFSFSFSPSFPQPPRYTWEDNEQVEKYVTEEFLINKVYGCHVVLTNVSMTSQKVDLLLQIPQGALPVQNGFFTKGRFLEISSYSTEIVDFYFYFPFEGRFGHFPVHVAKNEAIIANATPVTLNVQTRPSQVDTTSWDYISQRGTNQQLFDFLTSTNLQRISGRVSMIAWRMRDKDVFVHVTDILRKRFVFDQTLWAYSVMHVHEPTMREYLPHASELVQRVSPYLETDVLTVDPFDLRT